VYDAMMAESVRIVGHGGDEIEAYLARPLAPGPQGGVVVIHHMPGYDEGTKQITRTFAARGYLAICPNLHFREGRGAGPDDAAAAVRAAGGVPDDRFVGDAAGGVRYLRSLASSNGRVGIIGYCSGGRGAVLAACRLPMDAAVDCYGAFTVEDPPAEMSLSMKPILALLPDLSCPLLGLFGAEDSHPSPADVARLDEELTRLGKAHEFHTYDGAGHAFFAADRPSYRQAAAVDGWERIWDFLGRHLVTEGDGDVHVSH
jgi:carboxymethylenebutenolidase